MQQPKRTRGGRKTPLLSNCEILLIARALEDFSKKEMALSTEHETLKRQIEVSTREWVHTQDLVLWRQIEGMKEHLAELEAESHYALGEASRILSRRFYGLPEGHSYHSQNNSHWYLERVHLMI